MCKSPSALTVRSTRPCLATCVNMWSKKPTPVAIFALPVPSRPSDRSIFVSEVLRRTVAVRGMARVSTGEDSVQTLRQCLHLLGGTDRNAQTVPIVTVAHVADEDSRLFERLVNRLHRPI